MLVLSPFLLSVGLVMSFFQKEDGPLLSEPYMGKNIIILGDHELIWNEDTQVYMIEGSKISIEKELVNLEEDAWYIEVLDIFMDKSRLRGMLPESAQESLDSWCEGADETPDVNELELDCIHLYPNQSARFTFHHHVLNDHCITCAMYKELVIEDVGIEG